MTRNRMRLLRAALAVAAATTAAAVEARTCQIPRALLCEGCAESVTITLKRSGRCIISSTPAPGRAAAASRTNLPVRVLLELQTIRRTAPTQPTVATSAFIQPASRCFIFRERRYCE